MHTLGVDTSNYATSLAVYDSVAGEVVCAKKRLLPVKQGECGLRQSEAVFHHTAALPLLLEELKNETDMTNIAAVGVSEKPRDVEGSYMPCFLAGISFANAFAVARGVPLVTTSHQQGHVAAAFYAAANPALWDKDSIVFHISGGTTEMLLCRGYNVQKKLGGSLDLYAGQAVDRLGVKLGFAFPAGEALSALAAGCEEEPAPKVSLKGMDCHLSGLENQCERLLAEGKDTAYVAKYCLYAVADTVVGMVRAAHKEYPGLPVVCAGGVMASDIIRPRVQQSLPGAVFVPPRFSSDNAIGVAVITAKEAPCG